MPFSLVVTAVLILMTCLLIHDGYSQVQAYLITFKFISIFILLFFTVVMLIEQDHTKIVKVFKIEIYACLKELKALWDSVTTRKS